MMHDQTTSLWIQKRSLLSFPALSENCEVDVCIIGAGISGLTCAYLLSLEGKNVLVVDDGSVAGGETSRTTAHLTNALDDRYYNLEKYFGTKGSKMAAESHGKAINFIEQLVKAENIDCQFQKVNAYLFNPPGESNENLIKELQAMHRAGLTDVEMIDRAPFQSFDTGACLKLPNQAEFLPLAYIETLSELIHKQKGKICCETHVSHIEEGDPCTLRTSNGNIIKAKDVIIATNSPVNNPFFPHLKQASYRTYVIVGKIPVGYVPHGLYYDTPDPYHYIRVVQGNEEGDYLIVGGEDHRVGEYKKNSEIFEKLEKWALERFPLFQRTSCQWSGQIVEPVDSLAFIGRGHNHSHVYIATGDSGNGLTHGTIAGILITDLIMDRKNDWSELYDPRRKTLSTTKNFFEENINTLGQYTDWLTPGEINSVDELIPCSGAILRDGLKKIAVYKDEKGDVYKYSAECPHLEGLVRWNETENSWDCPCHGSRFNKEGKVINGPANKNLSPLQSD